MTKESIGTSRIGEPIPVSPRISDPGPADSVPVGAAPVAPDGEPNLVDLLSKLTSQGSHLAQQQLALVQAEIREAVDDLKAAITAMAGAAVVGISGLGVTLMALAYLLGDLIENLGLATLIVGLLTLLAAYLMYAAGKKKLDTANLKPERSIETVERTPDAATGNLTNGVPNDR